MRRRLLLSFVFVLAFKPLLSAESWDYIRTSGEYYYGVGVAATVEDADKAAMSDLVSQIATNVSSDFTQIDDVTVRGGSVSHTERVLNCIRTYSQTTLTDVRKFEPDGKSPNIRVRVYMKKSELARIFDNRISKAKNMLDIADECLDDRKIDMALQYYYWSYSLIRSVQFPSEVKDGDGRTLVDWIPVTIDKILSDIEVSFDKKDGDFTNLFFKYRGEPVSSLEFSYSDGRTICQGMAKDGRGMIEMLPGYQTSVYHLDIEYEYKSQARSDAEMQSVLDVITPKVFPRASVMVTAGNGGNPEPSDISESTEVVAEPEDKGYENPIVRGQEKISASSALAVGQIVDAFNRRSYTDVQKYFALDALSMFNRLTGYGRARVLDSGNVRYYEASNGRTVARGLKMSFSFSGSRKMTFVEDISLTFNKDNKIENVAFGLGNKMEMEIFNRRASWSDEARETIVSFMENYKTAYCLERIDYIREIFSDDAVIIVGNVVKPRSSGAFSQDGVQVSMNGRDVIKYNRYTKDSYIEHLSRCFGRNDFINLRFTDYQIQWLEKYESQTIFAINIRQEYNSSTYADDGYLFLLVDMTDRDGPLIKVRTWQPNEVAIDKLYNAGDFFND